MIKKKINNKAKNKNKIILFKKIKIIQFKKIKILLIKIFKINKENKL